MENGPGCGCWRPMVLGSIRSGATALGALLASLHPCGLFPEHDLSGSCAAAREINLIEHRISAAADRFPGNVKHRTRQPIAEQGPLIIVQG